MYTHLLIFIACGIFSASVTYLLILALDLTRKITDFSVFCLTVFCLSFSLSTITTGIARLLLAV